MTAIVASSDAFVRARVGADIKQRAGAALEAMGLSISDAIRLLLVRVANEGRLPFDLAAPWAADKREQEIVRERALRAFAALRNQAALNGTADMTLDEINEEIRAARASESVAA